MTKFDKIIYFNDNIRITQAQYRRRQHQMETITENRKIPEEWNLQNKIIDLLKEKGPITRPDMVRALGVARTTIYDSIAKLMANRVIMTSSVNDTGKRGRPFVLFQLI